jgi:hypothetical protein
MCYGAGQAQMPIYSGGKPKASKSHSHECVGFEQPFGLILSQCAKGSY